MSLRTALLVVSLLLTPGAGSLGLDNHNALDVWRSTATSAAEVWRGRMCA